MRFLLRARILTAAALTTGAVLLGVAVGGMASVDRSLSAATAAPAPATHDRRVVYELDVQRSVVDCPERATRASHHHAGWPEL